MRVGGLEAQNPGRPQVRLVIGGQLRPFRTGVDGVGEEAGPGRVEGRQDRGQAAAGEVAGQDDPVLDLDVKVIGREIEGARRAQDEPAAVIDRVFGPEVLGSQRAGEVAVDAKMPDVEWDERAVDVQEIRADRREVRLAERRRSEPGRGGAPEDELFGSLHPRRHLGVLRIAEIRVVLETARQSQSQK